MADEIHSQADPHRPAARLLAGSPLVLLLYWMWRIRLKQKLRGLITAKPIEA